MSLDSDNPDDDGPSDLLPVGSQGPEAERDLLVVIRLSNRQMGTNEERAEIALMTEQLAAAVQEAGLGEYDGDDSGGGECILFFCGPDEMALIGFLRPLLQRTPFGRGAHFVRLVEAHDGEMTREKVPV